MIVENNPYERFDISTFQMSPNEIIFDDTRIAMTNVIKVLKYQNSKKIVAGFINDKIETYLYWMMGSASILLILLNLPIPLKGQSDHTMIKTTAWLDIAHSFMISNFLVALIGIVLVALAYLFYRKQTQSVFIVDYYGIQIEPRIGRTQYLFSKNKAFIDKLYYSLEQASNDKDFVTVEANFKTFEIQYNSDINRNTFENLIKVISG